MPLQDHMKLISVDDHVIEHPNVWQDRLPERYRDAGPRIVEVDEDGALDATGKPIRRGSQLWCYEGKLHNRIALDAVAGLDWKEYGTDPYRFDQIIPGCYDPVERAKDMDLDGIQAGLCFPTFPRFAGTAFLNSDDKDLALLCVQAYNDFILDEWCAAVPGRQIPMVILPLWDPALAVAELERTAAKGARAISFVENPVPLGLPSLYTDHWDPVFAAAQEAQLPLCMHFGTSGKVPMTSRDAPMLTWVVLMSTNSMATTVDLLFSPIFHKFPQLKAALSEGGIGWLPYLIERADYVWQRHHHYNDVNHDVLPSEIFRRNVWGCFIDDDAGIRDRYAVGVDKIMWECDYPHSDSNWPHARKRLAEMLADVPDDEAHRISELNARELFRFDA